MPHTFVTALTIIALAACTATEPSAMEPPPRSSPPAGGAPTRWLAYQLTGPDGLGQIHLVHPDGTQDHEIAADLPGSHWHPVWSPSGQRLLFIRRTDANEDGELWILDVATEQPTRLLACTDPCVDQTEDALDPAERQLVFFYAEGPVNEQGIPRWCGLRLMTMADGSLRTLTRARCGTNEDRWPRWSPDGRSIVFVRTRGTPGVIGGDQTGAAVFVLDPRTRAATRITPWELNATWVDAAPNGRDIVVSTASPEGSTLLLVHADGSGDRLLTAHPGDVLEWPLFTDDGASVSYTVRQPDGSTALWTVDVASGHRERVMLDGDIEWGSFQPAG